MPPRIVVRGAAKAVSAQLAGATGGTGSAGAAGGTGTAPSPDAPVPVADAQVPVASGPLDLGRGGWSNLDDPILPLMISVFPPMNHNDTIVGRTVFILEMTTTLVHPDVHRQRYCALTRSMPGGMHLCFITVAPVEFVDRNQGVMSQAWLVSRSQVLPDDFNVQIVNFMTDYDDVTEFDITGSWNVTQHRFAGAGAADY
eukprot:786047-Rhodomonas_salina.1